MSLRTIGVIVRAAGTIRAVSVISVVGRIVVRAFTLCMTFTFVWRRFVRSGVVRRVESQVNDFFNVC